MDFMCFKCDMVREDKDIIKGYNKRTGMPFLICKLCHDKYMRLKKENEENKEADE